MATLTEVKPQVRVRRFLKIRDPHYSPRSLFEARFDEIQTLLLSASATSTEINAVDLLQDIDGIEDQVTSFLDISGGRILLDITSMPKRWFFPIIRFLLASINVETLIVTYTSAQVYGEKLSSDPTALGPLPTFDEPRENNSYDELVVGVGFTPLGLRDIFSAEIGRIRYLFPFPPGPPTFFRNWHFLRTLESEVENRKRRAEDRWQVDMYDVPGAFEALCRVTGNGEKTCALAPFGPKTLSLAMCLFALAAANAGKEPVHVYYTQPRRYAINYTTGIREVDGVPDIKAYCLRINGRNLYTL